MPDILEAESRREAVRGTSARKAKPIVPPPLSDDEAAEPALARAARDVMTMAIIRSWQETVRLGLGGFAGWITARNNWAKNYQELLQSTFNAAQQATKMTVQTSAQLFSMGATLAVRAAEPMVGRFGETR